MKLISLWSGIVNKATGVSSLRDANFTHYVWNFGIVIEQ